MKSASLGGDTVTENVKKRVSKWDLVVDPRSATETVQDNSKSGDAADVHDDKDLSSGWNLSRSAGNHVRKWSEMEGNPTMRSKDSFGESCWEPIPEGKSGGKYSTLDRGDEKISPTTRPYGASDASHVDAWRQHSRSRSPQIRGCRSHRSRSRSPQRFKRDAEGWTDRGRNGRGGSTAPCRDFSAGRCRRGSECRFVHQDGGDYEDRSHFDSGHFENRVHRQERGGFSRYARDEAFTDPQVKSGYPQEKQLHGYDGHCDGDREKREPQRNSRSSGHCNDFLRGKCYRGSACIYIHDNVNADRYGRWSSKDAVRERSHNKREDTSIGHDSRCDSSRSGNGLCKYFAEGRCRNGERCKFSHQGPTHGSSEWKSHDAGWGDNSIIRNRSWEGPKWSDKNSGSEVAYCENQSWNDPKWSDNTGDGNLSSNQSSDHSKWGDNTCDKNFTINQSLDHPKWSVKDSDKNRSISPWCSDSNNIKADDSGKRSWEGPTWGDKTALTNISNSPPWKSSDDGTRRGVPESSAADQFCNGADMSSSGVSGDGYPQNMGGKEYISNTQDSHTQNPEAEGEQQHVSSSATLTQPVALENSCIQQHPGLKADNIVFSCEDGKKFTDSTTVHHENLCGMSAIVRLTGQSSVECVQSQHTFLPQPSSNVDTLKHDEQNQQMAFPPNVHIALLPPNAQNFNPSRPKQQIFASLPSGPNVHLNGQSQPLAAPLLSGQTDLNGQSQQLMMQAPSEACAPVLLGKEEVSKNPDFLDANIPQPTSGNPVPQSAVTTEKGTQMTDLSASLAQIFGNGQQLPQLYATLNHLSATGLVPSHPYSESNSARPSEPLAVPFIHPDQGHLPQKQYDPIQGNTEAVKPVVTDQLPVLRFPVDIDEQKGFQQLQVPQQVIAPSSVTDGCNECGTPNIGSLEQSKHENNELSMGVEAVEVNEEATTQCQKDRETSHLKDVSADDQVDEGKRSKDERGMKMFKFALVEFVKELLKPTWKEGHMSREVHKTIVKKVVDKVTGSMQGPHLPQTQEKIDQYLSYSKPKLTKLVDAYVEKYLKI